jgi:hypothetical protein
VGAVVGPVGSFIGQMTLRSWPTLLVWSDLR